ncbi:MAG: hypothetical protein Q8R01_06755 [Ramlibacter sp.]|nr:hypothetical protein [Ramlibacter sp.]
MTIEHPVLRLGLAGFSAREQDEIRAAVPAVAPGVPWVLAELGDADAWWVNGSRLRMLDEATVKVAAAEATARSLRLRLPDIDRPVAFTLPLSCEGLPPAYTLDVASGDSMAAVLGKFEDWLSPLTAQLCLASHIVEHQAALGSGIFEVRLDGRLLAVVDMHGEAGVLPGTGPADFEDAEWRRRASRHVPEDLAHASMSQLMWQYSVRTQRDLLPRHYRTGLLYFRRPPRLPNRLLRDSHLLLMRELAGGPASFQALQRATGLHPARLAQDLAALYFVGTITSNPKRAPLYQLPRADHVDLATAHSSLPSGLDSGLPREDGRAASRSDLTAPAPLERH